MTLPTSVEIPTIEAIEAETGLLTANAINTLRNAINSVLVQPTQQLVVPVLIWDNAAGTSFNLRDAAARNRIALRWIPPYNGDLLGLDIQMVRTGTPTGAVWLSVQGEDGSALPDNVDRTTSNHMTIDAISTTAGTGQRLRFTFAVPVSMRQGQQYEIVLNGDYTVSAVNFVSLLFYNFGTITWPESTQRSSYDSGAGTWSATSSVGVFLGAAYLRLNVR